jgi:hypothetical protein
MSAVPNQADVDALRGLLDRMDYFESNDQRARYLLSSNWMRDRDAAKPAPQPGIDRETLMRLLHNKGAWCGMCDYEDGIDACEDCRICLGTYAGAVLALINGSAS